METHIRQNKWRLSNNDTTKDSSKYEDIFKRLEDEVFKLEVEIQHLESISKESKELLISIKQLLTRQIADAVNKTNSNNIESHELRKRVRLRKLDLTRLEHRLSSSCNANNSKPSSTTNLRDPKCQKSVTALKYHETQSPNSRMNGTGETADEVKSFETISTEILNNIKFATANERKSLEDRRDELLSEIEDWKINEMKNQDQSRKVVEDIKQALEIQKEQMRQIEIETERRRNILTHVQKRLCRMSLLLKTMNDGQLLDEHIDKADVSNILALMISKMKTALQTFEESNNKTEETTCTVAVALASCLLEEEYESVGQEESMEENSQEEEEYEDMEDIDECFK